MERIFAQFFEKSISPSAIAVGPNYEFVTVNDAWVRLFGFSREEAVGRSSYELGINRSVEARTRTLDQLNHLGSLRGQDFVLFSKSGKELHVKSSITRLEIDGKEYILTSLHDITEHEQIEEESRRQDATCLIQSLTQREREIISLAVAGHSNKEIAIILGISHRTVEVHRSHCIHKLGTRSLLMIKRLADTNPL